MNDILVFLIMSLQPSGGRHIGFHSCLSVCPPLTVCLSIYPSQIVSLHNTKIVQDIFAKLATNVDHTRCVQILMQLGKYLAFNHDLHEIGTCIV